MRTKNKGKRKQRKRNKRRTIKNVEKLRQETKRIEEAETIRLEAELKKIKEEEESRYKEELVQLEGRIAAFEKEKTEEDVLKEEKDKIDAAFEKEKSSIEDEENAEEFKYQKRVASIKEIPKKHKDVLRVQVSLSRVNSTTFNRELNFKSGPSEVVNDIVAACMQIAFVSSHFTSQDCTIHLKNNETPLDLYTELGDLLQKGDNGVVELVVILPDEMEKDGAEDDNDERLLLTQGDRGESEQTNTDSIRNEDEEDEEQENEDKNEEIEEEEDEISKRVQEFWNKLKEKTMDTLWEQKNVIRSKNEEEIKKKEEEYRKKSTKYSHVQQYINTWQEEKKGILERLRKKLKEKADKMKAAFESSADYKAISVCLPEEVTVSYNGIRIKANVDIITTMQDIFRQAHVELKIPLSTFSYLQDNRSTPPLVIPHSCIERVAVLYFGSKYVQLALRIPEKERLEEQAKEFRDLEEKEFLEKADLLKQKVERKEAIRKEDIPWPAFLQKLKKLEQVTCFQVFNVFMDDSPEFIKQTKKKKLLWWHPDKLLWKNSTLHAEDELIIKEWQVSVIHEMNEAKDKLTQWLSDAFPSNSE